MDKSRGLTLLLLLVSFGFAPLVAYSSLLRLLPTAVSSEAERGSSCSHEWVAVMQISKQIRCLAL